MLKGTITAITYRPITGLASEPLRQFVRRALLPLAWTQCAPTAGNDRRN